MTNLNNAAPGLQSAGVDVSQPYGSNRYIPPTFNWGRRDGRNDYSSMNWNNMQAYNLPQHGNNPFANEYMGGLREMLMGLRNRYPSQDPRMPQFRGGDPYEMFAGGRGRSGWRGVGGFDTRMLMAMMYRGMPQNDMFGGGGLGGPTNRPIFNNNKDPYGGV